MRQLTKVNAGGGGRRDYLREGSGIGSGLVKADARRVADAVKSLAPPPDPTIIFYM
jgi:hypothetical protein